MSLTAIECPDGVCHSHHGGHAVPRTAMQKNLQSHGKEWCERLAERIYEMSVDTYSQTVMPSLHSSGWQRKHLDWEFKLANKESEPDEALVEGIINATESFLRSSEVHRLFIQELVQGTFAEAKDDKLPSKAVRKVIENEIIVMIEGKKEELTNIGELSTNQILNRYSTFSASNLQNFCASNIKRTIIWLGNKNLRYWR